MLPNKYMSAGNGLSCGFPSSVVHFLCSTILEESTASVLSVTELIQACAKLDRSFSVM